MRIGEVLTAQFLPSHWRFDGARCRTKSSSMPRYRATPMESATSFETLIGCLDEDLVLENQMFAGTESFETCLH